MEYEITKEKNYEDYGVLGCKELNEYFKINHPNMTGTNHNRTFYFNGSDWRSEFYCRSKRQEIPLSEYIKLIEKKVSPENIEIQS